MLRQEQRSGMRFAHVFLGGVETPPFHRGPRQWASRGNIFACEAF